VGEKGDEAKVCLKREKRPNPGVLDLVLLVLGKQSYAADVGRPGAAEGYREGRTQKPNCARRCVFLHRRSRNQLRCIRKRATP